MKTFSHRVLLCLALALGATSAVSAQDLDAVRSRMEQRIETIDALKKQGVAGENNRGVLEVRAGDDKGAVAAENADRTLVYAAIAVRTGSSPEAVGRARARQIANASAPGVWVQNEKGEWFKK
jgi:uncharacterized protein YdbL (DUF1318 family)